jgi:hypothetical protein
MDERGGGARLLDEAAARLRIGLLAGGEELESGTTVEQLVGGEVHDAEAALSQDGFDAVMRDALTAFGHGRDLGVTQERRWVGSGSRARL